MSDLRAREVTVDRQRLPWHCPPPDAPLWALHPRVYLPLDARHPEVRCPYCSTLYRLAPPASSSSR
ncbi:MAG: zinc-finger domain-containing protein [Gammaproteobacteria bacterium]|nr:MAG: zinc-finger domain-containing protein [Gammaproteobacteria bacterium]